MSRLVKVYLRLPSVADCGVGYYRQWLPLMIAREKGKLDFTCHEFTWGLRDNEKNTVPEPSIEEMSKAANWADILYFARNDTPDYIAQAGGLRDFFKERDKIYKPIILDIDDNVHATRPYNPGYRSFHPNSPNLTWNIKSLGVFDAITVSTEDLKQFYSAYTDPSKIFVCPNSLDWRERDEIYQSDYSKSELFKKKDGEIRIGWTGSGAHWENLKHIEKSVLEVLRDYPQTTFYYSGLFGDIFEDKDLQDRIKKVSWSELKTWPKFNRECNFDIALAPLMDNNFNRAKSNLRILEYASAHYSVICSPVKPYNEFKNKEEVLFASEPYEWYDAMVKFITDIELRNKLATNLYKVCKQKYDINKNYELWVKVFKKVLAFSKNIT